MFHVLTPRVYILLFPKMTCTAFTFGIYVLDQIICHSSKFTSFAAHSVNALPCDGGVLNRPLSNQEKWKKLI